VTNTHASVNTYVAGGRKSGSRERGRWRRTLLASTAALSLGMQNAAWAVCVDGSTFPANAGGFVIGVAPAPAVAANWSPNVFTGTAGSLFIPDTSVHEHNNATLALTGGGHNWVFDQGSTLCKETDRGTVATAVATGWTIPPTTSNDCVILPIIRGVTVVNFGDIPFQGDVITPTCNPAILASTANTYFNQLGCSISHGVANTPSTATSFVFVAGIKGGLFSIPLHNTLGGPDAGKVTGPQSYYSAIPSGQKLTNAAVSKDGQFAIATSDKKVPTVFACLNPLGDPGDPTQPIDPNFFIPPAGAVACMAVGSNNLSVDLTTAFGPDNQPYFGGQAVAAGQKVAATGFGVSNPTTGAFKSAWPQCITQGTTFSIAAAFAAKSGGHCGNAQPNTAVSAALGAQTVSLISHGSYLYGGTITGPVMQFKVTKDATGLSHYSSRAYETGLSTTTGLGVADDLKALMVFTDPSAVGVAGQEVVTKLPLCEDMP
jgi:hypothetical protein